MTISRRSALALLGSTTLAPLAFRAAGAHACMPQRRAAPTQDAGGGNAGAGEGGGDADTAGLPVTGRVLAGLEGLDQAVLPAMNAHGVPGAAVAITWGGRLVAARGFGYADLQALTPMRPETPMVLASVSKVVTAQTILRMVSDGRLALGDRVFEWFRDLRVPEGMREDPRLNEITVQMCLQHTGGWDRTTSGDPSAWSMRIRRALHLQNPPTPFEMIRYMKGVPLDFDPGTRQVYSNFGFVLLGAVIAAVSQQAYPEYAQQHTLRPMGITGMRIDDAPPRYFPGEAHRYMLPAEHPVPGGNHRMVMAAGGWAANCIDLALLMTAIDGSRTGTPWLPPALMQAMVTPAPGIALAAPAHWMGLGWDQVERFPPLQPGGPERYSWAKDGGLAGVETWVQHMADGANFVLLFNSSVTHGSGTPGPLGVIRPKIIEFIRSVKAWPQGDLFAGFAPAQGV